jgi:aarF domain-containing kinase
LEIELGKNWKSMFAEFDEVPIAAASIGQVHRAVLQNGQEVAVKIQYPGVAQSIDSDLNNLVILLNFGKLLPKGLYLENTVRVARKELKLECDYIREADAMEKYSSLLENSDLADSFHVPACYKDYSSKRILTSELVHGIPIDSTVHLSQEFRDAIGENLLKLCLKELFEFRFMQTDPNWSNFLYDVESHKVINFKL